MLFVDGGSWTSLNKVLLKIINQKSKQGQKKKKVIFLGGENPHQCIPTGKKIEQWLTMWTSLWNDTHPWLRGGVANGKHCGLVMTT